MGVSLDKYYTCVTYLYYNTIIMKAKFILFALSSVSSVFIEKEDANNVLSRNKRFFGNSISEFPNDCVKYHCEYDEFKEIFENDGWSKPSMYKMYNVLLDCKNNGGKNIRYDRNDFILCEINGAEVFDVDEFGYSEENYEEVEKGNISKKGMKS